MRLLLIDNSNTRTKLAVGTAGGLEEQMERVPTPGLEAALLPELLGRFEFDAAVICSVVPIKAVLLRKALAGVPLHEISHRSNLPIGIDYPQPEQIGADRLANASAIHQRCGTPAIVIDFGTAVTFDVVGLSRRSQQAKTESPGSYLGGVIAPGLSSLTEYLHRRTALLPQIDLAEPESAIGKSTTAAMRAGAVYGYRGMIREILGAIRSELEADPMVVATGGDAPLIAGGLPEIREVVPDLTLAGIDLIGRRNL